MGPTIAAIGPSDNSGTLSAIVPSMQTTTTNRFETDFATAAILIAASLKDGKTVSATDTTALGNSLYTQSQTNRYTRAGRLYTGQGWSVLLVA